MEIEMNNSKIDQRMKEIEDEVVLLTDYMSEAVEKKLGVHINELKESIDKLQKKGIDIAKSELILPDFTEDLSGLKSGIDNITKIIGAKDLKTKDESFNRIIENNFGSIMEKLGSLDTDINEGIKRDVENKDELLKSFLENIQKIKILSENIQRLCTIDKEKNFKDEFGLLNKHVKEISDQIQNFSETSYKGLTSFEEVFQNTEDVNSLKQEELKKTLLGNFDTLNSSIDKVLQLCKTDENKQLDAEIALLSDKLEKVALELPNISKIMKNEVLQLNTGVTNSIEQSIKQQIEIRDALLKGIKNINDNAEVIRRMCSTDQEKFLGSMTTVVYNNMNELLEAMTSLQEKVKEWFLTIDKNIKVLSNKFDLKLEESKKIILYDINKLNDIAEVLKIWCTTEDNRPLGSEVISISNKVKKMFEETPLILEKVTLLNDQLDKVSVEVMRMRWFVVGAVAVSILVLIVSFFK
jgi:uncharacterized protein YqgV (UPF0045/DUF77 family)